VRYPNRKCPTVAKGKILDQVWHHSHRELQAVHFTCIARADISPFIHTTDGKARCQIILLGCDPLIMDDCVH